METAITITLAIISFLIGIIGFLIVRLMNGQKETNAELFKLINQQKDAISNLAITITELNGTMKAMSDKYDDHKNICVDRFKRIESKI